MVGIGAVGVLVDSVESFSSRRNGNTGVEEENEGGRGKSIILPKV